MRRTLRGDIHYLSWIRDTILKPGDAWHTAPISNQSVQSLSCCLYEFGSRYASLIFPYSRSVQAFTSLSEFEQARPHAEEVFLTALLYHEILPILPKLLDIVVPAFKRLIFTLPSEWEQQALTTTLLEQGIGESYALRSEDIGGSYGIICELLGMLPPKF